MRNDPVSYILTWEVRDLIRKAYSCVRGDIEKGFFLSPYSIGITWWGIFTPIENNAWDDIRFLGLPLYPQYPIGKYFVDFGDPFHRIAIEIDGAQWHKNKEKDEKRDNSIRKLGWQIYRIPGGKTFKTSEDFRNEDGVLDTRKYLHDCSEGILSRIYGDYYPRLRFEELELL